jgi:hypothetical protein
LEIIVFLFGSRLEDEVVADAKAIELDIIEARIQTAESSIDTSPGFKAKDTPRR